MSLCIKGLIVGSHLRDLFTSTFEGSHSRDLDFTKNIDMHVRKLFLFIFNEIEMDRIASISNISKNVIKSRDRMRLKRRIQRILNDENEDINNKLANFYEKSSITIPTPEIQFRESVNLLNVINDCHSTEQKLKSWVFNHNVTRRAVNDLLLILKSAGLNWLPNDSRTLCKTPRSTKIFSAANGKYWYNGIKKNLLLNFSTIQNNITIKLNFNVDGVPLYKSSSTEFWPIISNIHGRPKILQ